MPIHLVWTEAGFDRVNQPLDSAEGLTLEPPDEQGRVAVEAHGDLVLRTGNTAFRKGKLPVGRALTFEVAAGRGRLQAEGDADPLAGMEVGGYRLLSRLGAGAVGIVYRALQLNLEREVALKVLNPDAAGDPEKVASFRREAMAAGKLVHPNVVQVYDVGEDQGMHFYSMELMSRGSLEDAVREQGPLPWREALAAVRDCARALGYAAEHQLIHRDIKPENLMAAEDGAVKLADLGLASTRGLIHTEAAGGTPHFMAPEAISKVTPPDHRADFYSLGCTFYRLVTARTPYQGDTVRDILRAHRDEPVPSLREAGVGAPKAVDTLFQSLLAKDPEMRPATAADLVAACDRALSAGSPKLLVGTLIVALLGVGGWAGWKILGEEPPEPAAETVVEYVPDPRTSELEDRMRAQRVALAFAEAKAAEGLEERRAALEEFLAAHPQAGQAGEARLLLEELERRIDAAGEQSGEDAAASRALAELTGQVEADLEGGRLAEAIDRVRRAEDLKPAERMALRARVFESGQEWIGRWQTRHAERLAARDWEGARAVEAEMEAAIAASHGSEPSWGTALAVMARNATEAEETVRREEFRAARGSLLGALRGGVQSALLRMEVDEAAGLYQAAVESCAHAGLAESAATEAARFARAATAWNELNRRFAAAEETEIQDPRSGKHAVLLELAAEGPLLELQERGERVEKRVPWSEFHEPQAFARLLEVLAGPAGAPAGTADLYWLIADAGTARALQALAELPPSAEQAAGIAAGVRAWLGADPAPPRSGLAPAWSPRGTLERFAQLCEASAGGENYLAYQRLEQLESHWSLLGAWLSEGRATWGLQP